jgi:hypothetical protein
MGKLRIEEEEKGRTRLVTICVGEVFVYGDLYHQKTDESSPNGYCRCVSLRSGIICNINKDEWVEPKNMKLVPCD